MTRWIIVFGTFGRYVLLLPFSRLDLTTHMALLIRDVLVGRCGGQRCPLSIDTHGSGVP